MYDLKIYRNQWIEAYFQGDTSMLNYIEADDFFVNENGAILTKEIRLSRINNLMNVKKWCPIPIEQENLEFSYIDENECLIKGIFFSNPHYINILEKWIIEKNMWKIKYLVIKSMS